MWILILVLLIFIFIIVISSSTSSTTNKHSNTSTPVRNSSTNNIYKPQRIEDCVSKEDIQYQTSYETKRIIACIEKSKNAIKKAVIEANEEISMEWLNSYEKVIKISNNLDENLRYHSQQNLVRSKFQYYTSLHFRSMIAADITYREYRKIYKSFDAINQLIVAVDTKQKKIEMSRDQLISIKDSLKELKNTFLNRVHELNKNTGTIRDKIGQECGERGKEWWKERMKKHGK